MIELILGERGVNNNFTKKCVHSSYEMENVIISYWFFLENAMYGEMHILLYMIVFVSITEFWLLNVHFKIKLEVIF